MLNLRSVSLAAVAACGLFVTAFSATAEETADEATRRVELRFLGGEKREPLAGIEVLLTIGYGDEQRQFGPFVTDDAGTAAVELPPAFYSLHLSSETELPYSRVEEIWNGKTRGHTPSLNLRVTDTSAEKWLEGTLRDDGDEPPATPGNAPRITYNLLPACELVLRAVDADTGAGLPGAEFYEENALGEEWAHPIDGDNLGWKAIADEAANAAEVNRTDADGNFKRLVSASGGYAYGVARPPAGYEAMDGREVDLDIPYGQERAEHVFLFRRVQDVSR